MTDASVFEDAAPEPATVKADTPCRKCQYNLRGLSAESRCPECGAAVGLSLRGDLLCYSNPDWLDTLRIGVNLILWSVVIQILAAVVSAILGRGGWSLPGGLLSLSAGVIQVAGIWFLTAPDPGGLGDERYGTSRKLIRITIIVGLAQSLLNLAVQNTSLPPAAAAVFAIIGAIAGLVGVVGTFATLNYLSKLSMRIPDLALSARARLLMWGVGVPLSVLVLVGVVALVAVKGAGGAAVPLVAAGCIAMVCGLALIVFGIMFLLMLERLKTALKNQAGIARRTWAAGEDPSAHSVN
jgi:hypothetical protein